MLQTRFKKIVIKIGTNVITKEDGQLNLNVLESLVEQIHALQKSGIDLILVSSGAMGAARSVVNASSQLPKVAKRQVLASVGQVRLMNLYSQFFAKHHQICAQVLATREDFRDHRHYFNMKTCFESLLKEKIIPIVNENDVVSVEELMFTDNDELAGLIGAQIDADAVIILSNIDGLYDRDPKQPDAKIIPIVDFKKIKVEDFVTPGKSSFGRGGMITKCRIAKKLSQLGITTFIANGQKSGIIQGIINGQVEGTKFLPARKLSNVKRRIAYARGYEKGTVYINQCAEDLLKSPEKIISLLPIGIVKIEGEFEKGDLLKICNNAKKDIGLGIAEYSSKIALENIGEKNKKPLIHYDYLFLET